MEAGVTIVAGVWHGKKVSEDHKVRQRLMATSDDGGVEVRCGIARVREGDEGGEGGEVAWVSGKRREQGKRRREGCYGRG